MRPRTPLRRSGISGPLRQALVHEYKAQAGLRSIVRRFRNVRPFPQALHDSNRRVGALQAVVAKHGLRIPRDPWEFSRVGLPRLTSPEQSAWASATAERRAIALYEHLLEYELPEAVEDVFRRLRDGSRSRVAAFERACLPTEFGYAYAG